MNEGDDELKVNTIPLDLGLNSTISISLLPNSSGENLKVERILTQNDDNDDNDNNDARGFKFEEEIESESEEESEIEE